jgi:hypothetical protein
VSWPNSTGNSISYSGALHLKNDYYLFVLSILRHAVACLSVSLGYVLKVQSTGMFVANKPLTSFESCSAARSKI